MNKGQRNEIAKRKYKQRVSRLAQGLDQYVTQNGEIIYNPKTVDLLKDNAQNCYRTTSTPCSCYCCQNGKVEHRKKIRREADRLIREALREVEEFEAGTKEPRDFDQFLEEL